jgi:hypothetical protein
MANLEQESPSKLSDAVQDYSLRYRNSSLEKRVSLLQQEQRAAHVKKLKFGQLPAPIPEMVICVEYLLALTYRLLRYSLMPHRIVPVLVSNFIETEYRLPVRRSR